MVIIKGILKGAVISVAAIANLMPSAQAFSKSTFTYNFEGKKYYVYEALVVTNENKYFHSSVTYLNNEELDSTHSFQFECDGVKAKSWKFLDPKGYGTNKEQQEEADYQCEMING